MDGNKIYMRDAVLKGILKVRVFFLNKFVIHDLTSAKFKVVKSNKIN